MTDYNEVADYLVDQTMDWFKDYAGYENLYEAEAVLGISGGKDSSVVAAILCKALSPKQVHGVLMPNGTQADIQDSIDLCNYLGIDFKIVNMSGAFHWITGQIPDSETNAQVSTNLPARLRMATLYSIASLYNARVIGTGNFSEAVLGYTTLWGDSACDFNPIGSLYVDEVIAVGEALGLPEKFTRKPPSDGMCGRTDEENLGFTYDQFRQFYTDGPPLPDDIRAKIRDRIDGSRFKRNLLRGIPVIPLYRYEIGDNLGEIDLEATVTNNLRREKEKSLY